MTTLTNIQLGHVAVTTPDLDRLHRFYENAIGLRLVAIVKDPPPTAASRLGVFGTEAGVAMLAFEVPGIDHRPAGDVGERGPIDHFVFRVETAAELEVVAARLAAAGASDGAICELGRGPVMAVRFTDPDGRVLNVTCPIPTWHPGADVEILDPDLHKRIHSAPPVVAS